MRMSDSCGWIDGKPTRWTSAVFDDIGWYVGTTTHPVTVTTRIIGPLVGNPELNLHVRDRESLVYILYALLETNSQVRTWKFFSFPKRIIHLRKPHEFFRCELAVCFRLVYICTAHLPVDCRPTNWGILQFLCPTKKSHHRCPPTKKPRGLLCYIFPFLEGLKNLQKKHPPIRRGWNLQKKHPPMAENEGKKTSIDFLCGWCFWNTGTTCPGRKMWCAQGVSGWGSKGEKGIWSHGNGLRVPVISGVTWGPFWPYEWVTRIKTNPLGFVSKGVFVTDCNWLQPPYYVGAYFASWLNSLFIQVALFERANQLGWYRKCRKERLWTTSEVCLKWPWKNRRLMYRGWNPTQSYEDYRKPWIQDPY